MESSQPECLPSSGEIDEVINLIAAETRAYLASVDERPARSQTADSSAAWFEAPTPENGVGAPAALRELIERGMDATVANAGPKVFHFVLGGTTPAALGGDWLASALDQIGSAWVTSPLSVKLELISLAWLRDFFGLPSEFVGIMTTGACMANFVGLAAARQWWAEKHGVDVSENGLNGLPRAPVFSSGYVHASSIKVLAMLGMGRQSLRTFERDKIGRVDLKGMRTALRELDGAPAIIIANAGEVNAGDFDPIKDLAELASEYGSWFHIDGAFGLFAALSPRVSHLLDGLERADSVTVDGHKWLNVPYDCGFAFVRDAERLVRAFAYSGAYLPDPRDPRPNFSYLGPESSRRARSLAVWATLRAYGRQGYRAMVETHLDLAARMSRLVDQAPDLERLAETRLNIVCFRYNPGGKTDEQLNALNRRLGEAILEDGRFYVGATDYGGQTALRPALVNWRTRPQDIDGFISVVREIAAAVDGG